jgi:hypothetical protein
MPDLRHEERSWHPQARVVQRGPVACQSASQAAIRRLPSAQRAGAPARVSTLADAITPGRFPGRRLPCHLGVEERRGGEITGAVRSHLAGDLPAIGRPPPCLCLRGKLLECPRGRGCRQHDGRGLVPRSLLCELRPVGHVMHPCARR